MTCPKFEAGMPIPTPTLQETREAFYNECEIKVTVIITTNQCDNVVLFHHTTVQSIAVLKKSFDQTINGVWWEIIHQTENKSRKGHFSH